MNNNQLTKLSYMLRIKKLAQLSENIASCAHMLLGDEQDRNGLIEQLIINQREIGQIAQMSINERGGC